MEVDNSLIEELKELERDSPHFLKKCEQLAQELTTGLLTILQLVEQLGTLLVNTAPNNREQGTWILTHVIQILPLNHFDTKQLEYLCAFYTDRLKDNHQVIPAVLAGILALTKFEQFPEGTATEILTALFKNVACQQQQQQDRYRIYQILDKLLQKCCPEIVAMGLDYVYGVISTIDGERNPRNLVLLFKWFPLFCKNVNLGHLSEEAFEVLACYFPVDFKSPSNDSNQITRDDLANLLAPCLTAIPSFAEFCIPLALEKLDSSLEVAKLDALKLLEVGCVTFDTSAYIQNCPKLLSTLQKQIFNKPNRDIESACLTTLTAIVKKITSDSDDVTVQDITDTLKGNLYPHMKLFQPSVKFLLAAAQASRPAAKIVCHESVPMLLNAYNMGGPDDKLAVLAVLVELFYYYNVYSDGFEREDVHKVPIMCLHAAIEDDETSKRVGFSGLSRICQFLRNEIRPVVYKSLQSLVLLPQNQEFFDFFAQLATFYPDEVDAHVIGVAVVTSHRTLKAYFSCLRAIVTIDYFTQKLITLILSYIQNDQQFGQIAINSIRKILSLGVETDKIESILNDQNVTSTLINWCLKQENVDVACLDDVAFILKSLIGNLTLEQQQDVVSKQLEKITDFSKPSYVFLSYGVLCRVKRSVALDYKILNNLISAITLQDDGLVQNVGLQLIANLINKCENGEVLSGCLAQMKGVAVIPWVTKALVMRNHVSANVWTDKLINLLDTNEDVASSFRIIVDDSIDALSPQSNCIRTLLYQQKFFNIVSNRLCETYQSGRESYLVALGYLLENTPKQAILLQFNKILKLLIICLDECKQIDVLIILLRIISDFFINKETCVEDHFSEFLTRFLNLSTFDKSMKVRILALQCLRHCINSLPVYKLLPYKKEVLTVIGKVLDDKKRFVRNEAVETSSLWFLLDAPM